MRAAIRTVKRGIPTKSNVGTSSAMPLPSTPRLAQACLARVGPKSGPPCFLLPPTSVGATSQALSLHACAPRQPLEAMRSPSAAPTVGAVCKPGVGQSKKADAPGFKATKITRGLSCGTPKSLAFIKRHCAIYPIFFRSPINLARYSSNTESSRPRTFSNITAWGLHSDTKRRASGNKSRSSPLPNCFPALEKGGQGTPPAKSSTPRHFVAEK